MSVAGLALVLAAALVMLAIVLNHCYARLAVVELTLNEGLPPGYDLRQSDRTDRAALELTSREVIQSKLDTGVHVFLSRTCHACQRLVDELDQVHLVLEPPLIFHYVDRPRPIARSAASRSGAALREHAGELAKAVGADPLPFTIASGEHGLLGRSVTPTVSLVLSTARDAGIRVTATPVDA